jgi:Holliday junction DNA helicase RuvA
MIARLSGTLAGKRPGTLLVDVAGVGYEVAVPMSTYARLGETGTSVVLMVYTHVREGILALYGFLTETEKELFMMLIEVSGIGPRTAIAMLSGLGPEELVDAVRARDARRLGGVPGIGRKTADRVVLELADRLDDIGAVLGVPADDAAGGAAAVVRRDLISALVNLGYNSRLAADAAGSAIRGARTRPSFKMLLTQSLKHLSR